MSQLKVILKEKVGHMGGLGTEVSVKSGYARNYLLPQGKAVLATETNRQLFEAERAELEKKAQEILKQAEALGDRVKVVTLLIKTNASDEGKLYGSIGPREIVLALQEQEGIEVQKSTVNMPEGPIHEVGEHRVALSLHVQVTVEMVVQVEAAPAQ